MERESAQASGATRALRSITLIGGCISQDLPVSMLWMCSGETAIWAVTVRLHGISAGATDRALRSRMVGRGSGSARGVVGGWSRASARRNVEFLQSVREPEGSVWCYTLTVRDLPSSSEWRRRMVNLRQHLRDVGVLAWHWIVEWQRRGVPHVHLVVRLGGQMPSEIVDYWLKVNSGATRGAQHCKSVREWGGWAKYVGKHGARGVGHYQRAGNPWGAESTGRMWGYGGGWEFGPIEVLRLGREAWYGLRRRYGRWCGRRVRSGAYAGFNAWGCKFLLRGLVTEGV